MIFRLFILMLFCGPVRAELNCASVSLKEIRADQKAKGYEPHRMTQWHNVKKPKAVVIVTHGLNMRSDKMDHVMEELAHLQMDVLQLTLKGHGNNYSEFLEVQREHWLNDIHQSYCLAKRWSEDQKIPLYFTGYSLSGAVVVDLLLQRSQVVFEKMVLFSPAITPTRLTGLVKWVTWTGVSLPSQARKWRRAHDKTPAAAYDALFHTVAQIKKSANKSAVNVPTLVIMDKNDELVHFERLKSFVEEHGLNQWKFHTFTTNGDFTEVSAKHHIVVDKTVTGPEVWAEIRSQITQHILP